MDFSLTALAEIYAQGATVAEVLAEAIDRADTYADPAVWIERAPAQSVIARAAALDALPREARARLPLFGVPFAVKDNIDVAGYPTTAACPAYGYWPEVSASVVARLEAAGAIMMGKTNLDQFATGLVGTRSPYGAPRSVFSPSHISGGSSSGSAVAVAAGLVSFALGTDTAGSGRVPAGFNNIVGLKPTRGLIPTTGVVPACRSLDCVSIFALSAKEAGAVLSVAEGPDGVDAYARSRRHGQGALTGAFRFGVPADLDFDGDMASASVFEAACGRLEAMGGVQTTIDFSAFSEAAALLYQGPWVAERYAAVGAFLEENDGAADPVVSQIVLGAKGLTAVAAFEAQYRLADLKVKADAALATVDVLVTPTAPRHYTVDEIEDDPVGRNSRLGTYTNYMNLLDLAGLAVPAGLTDAGMPVGLTLVGPAYSEARLSALGEALQAALPLPPGAPRTGLKTPPPAYVDIAVMGAHMSGLPLNHELTGRGGRFLRTDETAPRYRFYALAGGPPKRPGMVRVADGGATVPVEIWRLPTAGLGGLLAGIPSPLGLGQVELADGSFVTGFLCEPVGTEGAEDITDLGGWRAFLARG